MSECLHPKARFVAREVFSAVWCPYCGALGLVYFHPIDDESLPLSGDLQRAFGVLHAGMGMWADWKKPAPP